MSRDPGARPAALGCRRADFSLPAGLHYLDCAYMSPLPRRVEEAGVRGVGRKRDPSRITADDFFREVDGLRVLFARLIGARAPERVAIVPAVSYALAAVARNEPLERGRRVVVCGEQFPSNVYPWRAVCAESGAELRTVAPPASGPERGAEWNARLLEAIERRTAIVALPAFHWTDGTRFDLEAIGERAREVGAALVVDGTQSVGAVPFEVERVRPDALACAGYKWLLGPYAIGLAWYGPRYEGGRPVEEGWAVRPGSEDFRRLVEYRDGYRPGAVRYDVGEASNFVLVPMLGAALELILEWSVEAIAERCAELTREIAGRARRLGIGVEEERWRGPHLLGLRLPPGAEADAVRSALASRRVHVSARGSSVRVSPHAYNDEEDVEALIEGLRSALS